MQILVFGAGKSATVLIKYLGVLLPKKIGFAPLQTKT